MTLARRPAGELGPAERGFLPVWGLENRRLDLGLTLLTVVLLMLSRFALLASGPWEWDETIFARGMLDFELAAHFPQPPGFPGMLALGHLLLPFAGSPYRALQLVSAIASVLAFWPLAALGRKVASPAVAAASALLVLSLPGPWLFSVRGFSTITATFFLVAAAALWASGLAGRKATVFTVLLTVAFLVRPILLPTVGLLWLVGLTAVKPLRRVLPGMVIGVALIAVAVAVMVELEGGWPAFLEPFFEHASYHSYRLDRNTDVMTDFGLITGAGGPLPAALLLLTASLGLLAWARKVGWRASAAWIVTLVLTATQLIMLQNRSYARYAAVVQIAAAPLIAGAAGLLPAPLALLALGAAGGVAVQRSYPLLREQHDELFGAWEATLDAASIANENDWVLVVEPEIYPFASYWSKELERRGEPVPAMVLSPRAPEDWSGIDRPWVLATVHPHLYLRSLAGRSTHYGEVSEAMAPLTQRRFLSAVVSENPPLPVGQWWAREQMPDGRTFMWAGPEAEIWLPPLPAHTRVGVELAPASGETPVEVEMEGETIEVDGNSESSWVWLRTTRSSPSEPVVIALARDRGYRPGGGDDRLLSVQLRSLIVRPPGTAFAGGVVHAEQRAIVRLEIEGAYGAEVFAEQREGLWLRPEAIVRIAVDEPGRLGLEISAPRPTRPVAVVRIGKRRVAENLEIDSKARLVLIDVQKEDIADGVVALKVSSVPFVPSAQGGSLDSRPLGVVLHAVAFTPVAGSSAGWWNRRVSTATSSP